MTISTEKQRTDFIRIVQEFKLDGKKRFIGEFKQFREKRSIKQNSLYHSWLNCIEKETGNDHDAMHEFFKRKFLSFSCHDIYGEEVAIPLSTTKLDTKQFTDFLENVKMFMQEQGTRLPIPGEPDFDEFWSIYGERG